jgi:hypothetical protein
MIDPATVTVLSDLIKIGIPSLVALAGTVASGILAIKGHRKDLEIERLRDVNAREQERSKRSGELVRMAAVGVSRLQLTALTYANMLFAKLDMEKDKLLFPDGSQRQLSAHYQELTDQLHSVIAVQAQILLTGDVQLVERFKTYWGSMAEFCSKATPSDFEGGLGALKQWLIRLADSHDAVFEALSNLYMSRGAR